MCGIVGQINKSEEPINSNIFNSMRDTLSHRGPDGFGTEFFNRNKIALGHRRLSIIDLSEDGHQPMSNENNEVWITFNGEIYNYNELRNTLLKGGHVFKSRTDTEVLIHGYEEWGISGLIYRIKGMFAFALYDSFNQKMYLVRDRFGIKPLYYYDDKSKFIFSSEIKAILKDKDVSKELDEDSLADFFIYSFIPDPNSIWKNIKKLSPGCYLEYDLNSNHYKINKYWILGTQYLDIPDEEAIERTDELLSNSVKEHLTSDVPVTSFLSAGYDSSSILMYSNLNGHSLSSYTIGFKDSSRSEHDQAKEIANLFNSCNNQLILNNETLPELEKLSYYFDEPFAVSSMIPYYKISKYAAQSYKVALVGDGGDEAFAGYKWHYYINDYFGNYKNKINFLFKSKKKVLLDEYQKFQMGSYQNINSHNVLNDQITRNIRDRNFWYFEKNLDASLDPVKAYQLMDVNTFIPEPCLTRADRTSMANSLELRLPFLDHRIFEFTFSLATNVYFKKGIKKYLLYKNLNRKLNDDILNLPKRGFSYQFADQIHKEDFVEFATNSLLKKKGLLSENFQKAKVSPKLRWNLIVLEYWMRKWL